MKAEVNDKGGKTIMKLAKIGTLFLVTIIALAGVGASYAAWSGDVDINANVTTGNFNFQIQNIQVIDDGGANIIVQWNNNAEWTVTVTNTYPGWEGIIDITHQNAGTVALRFESMQVLWTSGSDYLRNNYWIKFYDDSDNVNFEKTCTYLLTKRYYDDEFGGPGNRPWFTINAGLTKVSRVGLKLGDITGNYNTPVVFTFRLTAVQTTPI